MQHDITIGTQFHHVVCGYNMEVVNIIKKKGNPLVVEVKYLDRNKPNWLAPIDYLKMMFSFNRFAPN